MRYNGWLIAAAERDVNDRLGSKLAVCGPVHQRPLFRIPPVLPPPPTTSARL